MSEYSPVCSALWCCVINTKRERDCDRATATRMTAFLVLSLCFFISMCRAAWSARGERKLVDIDPFLMIRRRMLALNYTEKQLEFLGPHPKREEESRRLLGLYGIPGKWSARCARSSLRDLTALFECSQPMVRNEGDRLHLCC
jgi:hypothetical protein